MLQRGKGALPGGGGMRVPKCFGPKGLWTRKDVVLLDAWPPMPGTSFCLYLCAHTTYQWCTVCLLWRAWGACIGSVAFCCDCCFPNRWQQQASKIARLCHCIVALLGVPDDNSRHKAEAHTTANAMVDCSHARGHLKPTFSPPPPPKKTARKSQQQLPEQMGGPILDHKSLPPTTGHLDLSSRHQKNLPFNSCALGVHQIDLQNEPITSASLHHRKKLPSGQYTP